MASELSPEINALSIPDRIRLVGQIWDSIAEEQATAPLSESQRAELDRRVEDFASNPDEGDSWENVKRRIRGTP